MFAVIHAKFSDLAVYFPVADVTLFECEGKGKFAVVLN
jgi:hypothetical protein